MNPESELLGDEPVRLPREREVPGEPPPGRRRRRPARRWCGLAAGLLVLTLAGGALAAADGRARARETAHVARCAERLRIATGYAERRLGLVTSYVEPVLASDGRVQQLHLADLMAARAERVLPRVQRADRYCSAVHVRPWHFALTARQGSSTAYAAALVTLVQTVAAQGRESFRVDQTLQRLRDEVGVDGG